MSGEKKLEEDIATIEAKIGQDMKEINETNKEIQSLISDTHIKKEQIRRQDQQILETKKEIKLRHSELIEQEKKKKESNQKQIQVKKRRVLTKGAVQELAKFKYIQNTMIHRMDIYESQLEEKIRSKKATWKKQTIDEQIKHYTLQISLMVKVRFMKQLEKLKKLKVGEGRQFDEVIFRIDYNSTFQDVMESACQFWTLSKEKYQMTDDQFNSLSPIQIIAEYFSVMGIKGNTIVVFIQEKRYHATMHQLQEESTRLIQQIDQQTMMKQQKIVGKARKRKSIDRIKKFFEKYPGMKLYIGQEEVRQTKREPVRYTNISDMHCFIFTCNLIIFFMTVLNVNQVKNSKQDYFLTKEIIDKFKGTPNTDDQVFDGPNGIQTKSDVYKYIYTFGKEVFIDQTQEEEPLFKQQNKIFGNIRMRQHRTPLYDFCPYVSADHLEKHDQDNHTRQLENVFNQTNVSCIQERYEMVPPIWKKLINFGANLEPAVQKDDQLPGTSGLEGWMFYNSSDKLKEDPNIKLKGMESDYDNSGYVIDFNKSSTLEEFTQEIEKLKDNNYIDLQTRAIVIYFTFYNYDMNKYFFSEFLIEFPITGTVIPSSIEINSFQPYIFGPDRYKETYVNIKLWFMGIYAAIYAYILFWVETNSSQKEGEPKIGISEQVWNLIYYSCTFNNISNMLIIQLSIQSYMAMVSLEKYSDNIVNEHFISQDVWVDFKKMKYYYNKVLTFDYFMLSICYYRFCMFLKLFIQFKFVIYTIEKSAIQMFFYMMIQVPILLGFTFIGMNLWGTRILEYSTFYQSLLSNVQIIIGEIQAEQMLEVSTFQTIIYVLLQYQITVYFVIGVIFGIYQDSYTEVVQQQGYPNNYEKEHDFRLKDFLKWLFSVQQILMCYDWYKQIQKKRQQQKAKEQAALQEKLEEKEKLEQFAQE